MIKNNVLSTNQSEPTFILLLHKAYFFVGEHGGYPYPEQWVNNSSFLFYFQILKPHLRT